MAPGARNKFDLPWEQMCCIEESTNDIVGTFRRPQVIRPPGHCAPIAIPSLRPGIWFHLLRISEASFFVCLFHWVFLSVLQLDWLWSKCSSCPVTTEYSLWSEYQLKYVVVSDYTPKLEAVVFQSSCTKVFCIPHAWIVVFMST